jgi:glutamate-1-semialdehyde 2,1-aminomutase
MEQANARGIHMNHQNPEGDTSSASSKPVGPAMSKSVEFFGRSQKVSPGGVHSPVRAFKSVGGNPVFFSQAEGAYLTSVDGVKYIDFCQSFGPLILGHRDPDVAKIVHATVDMAWSFGACEPYSTLLAEWITARVPWVEKLRFVTSGTEAVMSALRVARAATGRSKILKFEGCYHGSVDSLLVKAGSGLAGGGIMGDAASDSAGVSAHVASETIVALLDDEEAFAKIFALHKKDLAAVIIEPLPANYGLLIQRKEFLQRIQKECAANNTILIFDEVISGFRVALGGMAERLGMRPDLVTYGKVIGGGFPVGCYGGRKDLLDLVAPSGPVYQAGTLSASPVGMRAGLATLTKIESQNVYQEIEKRTEFFVASLNDFFSKNRFPVQMSSLGSIFWMHKASDKVIRSLTDIPAGHADKFREIFHACLRRQVYLAPSGYEVGFISLAHTPEILKTAIEKIQEACREAFQQ